MAVDLQLVLCALSEVKHKIERLMSNSFIHGHAQEQINFKALTGYIMFLCHALQIYKVIYNIKPTLEESGSITDSRVISI